MLERAHRHLAVALVLGATALVGACAGGEDANEDTTALGSAPGALDTAGGAAAGEMSDAQIFGFTSFVNNAEVQAGQLAQEKGSHARVKEYARMMVTDHSNNERQAGELAQQLNVNPTEPADDEMKRQHDELMNRLRDASGAAFDSLYITGMVQEHQETLQRLNAALNATQEAQVQQFLNETRQKVQQHLERAQQIQGELAGGGR